MAMVRLDVVGGRLGLVCGVAVTNSPSINGAKSYRAELCLTSYHHLASWQP
ncbi:hypothetical protein IG631_04454 [Alternaria alternata]|jgi:hypothetical protein|nr:hypothetical protein IG631_04454 [Alternaria alternata]